MTKEKSHLTDFSNIGRNSDAQKFLLDNAGTMSAEELHAEIINRQRTQSSSEMEQRDKWREEASLENRPYDSFLDTKEKEIEAFGKIENLLADKAISWLEKELERKQRKNGLDR